MVRSKRKRDPYLKFKSLLFKKGISQKELAEILEKSTSTISANINGTGGDFSLEDIRVICKHFNISADEYFIHDL